MKSFSSRYHYDPKQPKQPFLEEAPEWVRIGYTNGILTPLLYIDHDPRYQNDEDRPLGIKDLHERFSVLLREEIRGEYYDSWTCADELSFHIKQVEWYHFFDFVELVGAQLIKTEGDHRDQKEWLDRFGFENYRKSVNEQFETDAIGWRLNRDGKLARPMPPALEKRIVLIEEVLGPDKFSAAREHYGKAVRYANSYPLDPENSIKETVSAVESVCVTLFPKASTLGDAIKEMKKSEFLPTMLVPVLEKFWGYTSEEPAVRHGKATTSRLQLDDAELALHIGAAMIRYILRRNEEMGAEDM